MNNKPKKEDPKANGVTSNIAYYSGDKESTIIEKEYFYDYYGGFSLAQKKRMIEAFHKKIRLDNPNSKPIECTTKSDSEFGFKLSAFNLKLTLADGNKYPVECVYQASKVDMNGSNNPDWLAIHPREAKENAKALGPLKCFRLDGVEFPLFTNDCGSIFYDYIYIKALSENPDVAKELLNYDCFTDILAKSINGKPQGFACVARACALYKIVVANADLDNVLKDYHNLLKYYYKY